MTYNPVVSTCLRPIVLAGVTSVFATYNTVGTFEEGSRLCDGSGVSRGKDAGENKKFELHCRGGRAGLLDRKSCCRNSVETLHCESLIMVVEGWKSSD